MTNPIDGLTKFYELRVVFMENTRVHEFTFEIPDGIEFKYLTTLYKDIERLVNRKNCQLLVVMPIERTTDSRVPVFITQDFDNCSSFSVEGYFKQFGLSVKKSNGKVRRVK